MRQLLAAASLLLLASVSSATQSPGSPSPSPPSVSPSSKSEVVEPGESFTNGDGVTVANESPEEGGYGTATITPKEGDGTSETTVKTKPNFEGAISGLDGNDTVNIGPTSEATVAGAGGNVTIGGNSIVTVQNTGPQGGPSTTVTFVGGAVAVIPPGSSVTFGT